MQKQFKGLTSQEVLESRRTHGENVLTPPVRESWWKLYLEKYDDPVIRILLIAACIAFLVGLAHNEYVEAVGIVVAVFLATTMASACGLGTRFKEGLTTNDTKPTKKDG